MKHTFYIDYQLDDLSSRELDEDWSQIVGITGTIKIMIGNKSVYSEASFPLYELALGLKKWLLINEKKDYIHKTIESEEEGLVWIKKVNNSWKVGSIYQEKECDNAFSINTIEEGINKFIIQLINEMKEIYNVDLNNKFV